MQSPEEEARARQNAEKEAEEEARRKADREAYLERFKSASDREQAIRADREAQSDAPQGYAALPPSALAKTLLMQQTKLIEALQQIGPGGPGQNLPPGVAATVSASLSPKASGTEVTFSVRDLSQAQQDAISEAGGKVQPRFQKGNTPSGQVPDGYIVTMDAGALKKLQEKIDAGKVATQSNQATPTQSTLLGQQPMNQAALASAAPISPQLNTPASQTPSPTPAVASGPHFSTSSPPAQYQAIQARQQEWEALEQEIARENQTIQHFFQSENLRIDRSGDQIIVHLEVNDLETDPEKKGQVQGMIERCEQLERDDPNSAIHAEREDNTEQAGQVGLKVTLPQSAIKAMPAVMQQIHDQQRREEEEEARQKRMKDAGEANVAAPDPSPSPHN